jgi:hypothetical protein
VRFVQQYHPIGGGSIQPGLGSLDTTQDQPLPGGGFWYLVRYPTPCGSWETLLGEQPGRSAALP